MNVKSGFVFVSIIIRSLVFLSVLGTASLAEAEGRYALVIGNNDYKNARPLANPGNDAAAMARALESVGFEVILRVDATLKDLKSALREFIDKLPSEKEEGAVALVFFAGHGVQIGGKNYLIPVDAEMSREFEVPDETLSMDAVMRGLESAGAGLNILVLDCCRNDPFSRSWRGSRSATGGGLAMPKDAPQGMFIAFATSPGSVAEDGEGNNSPYTGALIKHLPSPGTAFEEVFKSVGGDVSRVTSGAQQPWYNSKFYGNFAFVPKGPGAAQPMGSSSGSTPSSGATPRPKPVLRGTPVASGEEDLDGDGAKDRVSVVMTDGQRYEDTELWAGAGKKFEGTFLLRIEFGDGTLAETNLNGIFDGEDPLFFRDEPWKIQFNDYNRDGKPDFNLGVYASSNGSLYKLFTLDAVRTVSEMRFSDRDGLFITDTANSTTKIPVGPGGIVFERYDNTEGRIVKQIFRWDDDIDQFVFID